MLIPINDTTFGIVHEVETNRETIIGDSESNFFLPKLELYWQEECLSFWKDTSLSLNVTSNVSDMEHLVWQDSQEKYTFTQLKVDKDPNISDHIRDCKGVKFTIRLNAKPSVDVDGWVRFPFKISGIKNLNFFLQEAPTSEEIAMGAERHDCVIGSYAVYHKTKRNNSYQTGKAFHIHRPWCRDSENNFTWGKWELDEVQGTLTKCIPQSAFEYKDASWWDVDASFGQTSCGASTYGASGFCFSTEQTSPAGVDGASVTHIGAFVKNTSTERTEIEVAMYTDDAGNDCPEVELAGANPVGILTELNWDSCGNGSGAKEEAYAPSETLSASTDYWMCVRFLGTIAKCYYDGSGGSTDYKSMAWPDPWPHDGSHNAWIMSLYCVYTAGGVAYTKTINEAINISESLVRALSFKRIVSETLKIIESISRSSILKRIVSSGLDIADNIKRVVAFKRFIDEPISITETLTKQVSATLKKIISETVDIAESLNKHVSILLKKIISESITITESLLKRTVIFKVISEAIGIIESLKSARTLKRIISESISLIENIKTVRAIVRKIAETVAFIEDLRPARTMFRILSSSLGIVESIIKSTGIEIIIKALRRIFTFDNYRRIFTKDTSRKDFHVD